MMISAADAKTKWCPYATIAQSVPNDPKATIYTYAPVGGLNRAIDPKTAAMSIPDGCKCLADGCMAWRWGGWAVAAGGPVIQNLPSTDRVGPQVGYCGAGVKPYGAT